LVPPSVRILHISDLHCGAGEIWRVRRLALIDHRWTNWPTPSPLGYALAGGGLHLSAAISDLTAGAFNNQ
jgi:hypothetical protein